jgi:hypothetical protein
MVMMGKKIPIQKRKDNKMEITKRIGIFGRTFLEGTLMFEKILGETKFKDIERIYSDTYTFITKDGTSYAVYGADKSSEGLPQIDEACVCYAMPLCQFKEYVLPLLLRSTSKVRIFSKDAFSEENKS